MAVQELEGQVQAMHLPEPVEKAWKDVEHDLSDNPISKGVDSLQKLTDPSVRRQSHAGVPDVLQQQPIRMMPPNDQG